MSNEAPVTTVDREDLRSQVKEMYTKVAEEPQGPFHFEMGRALAERLGYAPADLDRIPPEAIESFAGVGFHFGLAGIRVGEAVLDLGSGSGMDAFLAALQAGPKGRVIGLDMTDSQLEKAEFLRRRRDVGQLSFRKGYLEEIPLESASVDVVISNGVINLCPDKPKVFQEAARVLRPGGRLAISDIVTDIQLTPDIVCNASLWAACIGGAMQREAYRSAIEAAGFKVVEVKENPAYRFLSKSAQGATRQFGVRSVSLLAVKA
jgi:ubiquinone/menaquinone biosynthesis C-methylase UbiE